jgi:hypothetical protein
MARRNPSNTKVDSSESTSTEVTEETAVSTTAEAPASTEEKTETPVDLTGFEAATAAAVAEADTSTGTIPPSEVEKVVVEYRTLDGIKAKNKAKAFLNEGMKSAMNESDIVKARSYLQLTESMSAGSPAKSEKAPADPTEAFVQRSATLQLAQSLLVPGEGVAEDHEERTATLVSESQSAAEQYLAWVQDESEDKGDEPEVSTVVRNAVKLALGKAAKAGSSRTGGGYTGERRDIGKHIEQAFADHPVGTFLTVAEIRKFVSDEYGQSLPSAGAISARLFPQSGKCTIESVRPDTNEKGNKGAEKIA